MILESHDTVPPQLLSHPLLSQHYFENYGKEVEKFVRYEKVPLYY